MAHSLARSHFTFFDWKNGFPNLAAPISIFVCCSIKLRGSRYLTNSYCCSLLNPPIIYVPLCLCFPTPRTHKIIQFLKALSLPISYLKLSLYSLFVDTTNMAKSPSFFWALLFNARKTQTITARAKKATSPAVARKLANSQLSALFKPLFVQAKRAGKFFQYLPFFAGFITISVRCLESLFTIFLEVEFFVIAK